MQSGPHPLLAAPTEVSLALLPGGKGLFSRPPRNHEKGGGSANSGVLAQSHGLGALGTYIGQGEQVVNCAHSRFRQGHLEAEGFLMWPSVMVVWGAAVRENRPSPAHSSGQMALEA